LARRPLRGPGSPDPDELVPTIGYVVLCHPRSGSNMLIHALRQHPSVRAYGEIFQDEIDARRTAYRGHFEVYLPEMDGADFLRKIYCECYFDEILSVGFKLFYEQARHGRARTAWDYLRHRKEIRVLHLTRERSLDAYVSLCEAKATDRWVLETGEKRPDDMPPVVLDVDACLAFLNESYTYSAWVRSAFADHPFLDLQYDADLCASFPQTIKKVQEFLEVPVIDLPQRTQKQGTHPLKERVSNYAEVMDALRHTLFSGER
jgi:LPS sulfotransferase NodH